MGKIKVLNWKDTADLKERQLLIGNVRVGFPTLWEPQPVKNDPNGRKRYSIRPYIPYDEEAAIAKINEEIRRVVKEDLGGVMPKDTFFRDGKDDPGAPEGCFVISANRQERQGRPAIIDKNRSQLTEKDAKIYAGCRCNIMIGVYTDQKWHKLNASLEIVQYWGDDDPFGAARPSTDIMAAFEDEDDESGFEV